MLLRSETTDPSRPAAPMSVAQWRRIFGHDLRAPLRQARCYAELLQEQAELFSPAARADLDQLRSSLDTLDVHWRSLLQWGGLETDPAQWQAIPLAALLRGLEIRLEPGSDPEQVLRGDPLLLEPLFQELQDNALRHAGASLRIQATRQHDGCLLAIGDDGPGLPAGIDPDLWLEPLTRGEHSPGSGMGLAMVARICRLHGGNIRPARSPATHWHITLPGHPGDSL